MIQGNNNGKGERKKLRKSKKEYVPCNSHFEFRNE